MSFDLPRSSYGYENLASFANNREPPPTYRSTSPNLLDFTPGLLIYMAAAESGRLIFRRIAPAQVNAWLRRCPEVVENPDIRYEYDSLTQRFMIKCSPCAVHESFSIFFKTVVILGMASKLGSSTVKKILQVSSGSGMHLFHRSNWGCGLMDTQHIAFSGFSSEYALDSERFRMRLSKWSG